MTPDEKLDEALKETFPASDAFYISTGDPVSVGSNEDLPREIPGHAGGIGDISSENPDSGQP